MLLIKQASDELYNIFEKSFIKVYTIFTTNVM